MHAAPVVVLLPDDALVTQLWAAGARGMLLRNADPEMITRALAAVEGGLVVIDPDLAEPALALREPAPALDELTPREEHIGQTVSLRIVRGGELDELAVTIRERS